MNQANINTQTEKYKIGDLVKILFQGERDIFGLIVSIYKKKELATANKRNTTMLKIMTHKGIKTFPIFWCELV